MIFFWQVDINNWQVNIKIWQVDIIIWKVMAQICLHKCLLDFKYSGIHGYDIYIRFAFPLRCTTYLGHLIYAIYSRESWSHWYRRMNISIKIYISILHYLLSVTSILLYFYHLRNILYLFHLIIILTLHFLATVLSRHFWLGMYHLHVLYRC